jgi:hypothetical protein
MDDISNMTIINNLLKEHNNFVTNMCNLYYKCDKMKRDIIDQATSDDDNVIFNLQISNCICLVSIQKYVLLEIVLYIFTLITMNNCITLLQKLNINIKQDIPLQTNPNVEELTGGGLASSSTIIKSFIFLFISAIVSF